MLCPYNSCEFGIACIKGGQKYQVVHVNAEHTCQGPLEKKLGKKKRKMVERKKRELASISAPLMPTKEAEKVVRKSRRILKKEKEASKEGLEGAMIEQDKDVPPHWSLSHSTSEDSHAILSHTNQSTSRRSRLSRLSRLSSSSSIEIIESAPSLLAQSSAQASTSSQRLGYDDVLGDKSAAGLPCGSASNHHPYSSTTTHSLNQDINCPIASTSSISSTSKRTLDRSNSSQSPRHKTRRLLTPDEDLLLDYSQALDNRNQEVEESEVPRDVPIDSGLEQDFAMNEDSENY
ncbi:hypothetical protein JCM3765_001643 [Sporobolomyces pararoseus]